MLIIVQGCGDAATEVTDESSNDGSQSSEGVLSSDVAAGSSDEDGSSSSIKDDDSSEESSNSGDSSSDGGPESSSEEGSSSSDVEQSSSQVSSSDNEDDVSSSEMGSLVYPVYTQDPEIEKKVSDLLGQMTTEEKVGQMIQGIWFQSDNIESDIKDLFMGSLIHASTPNEIGANDAGAWASKFESLQNAARQTRLGIPLLMGIDAVHGNAFLPKSVVFPHNIGMGATRNEQLAYDIGQATAKAVAATGMHLTFGPVANISNNEKWGRMYESFGENSEEIVTPMTKAVVYGLQGDDLANAETISACAKHYFGDGVAADGHERGESQIDDFGPHYAPYQATVDMGIGCVMAAFTQVNGKRMHHNETQLDYLKKTMGFDGIVVTDWVGWTVGYDSEDRSIKSAVNAGVDLLMAAQGKNVDPGSESTAHHTDAYEILLGLVDKGVSMERIDDAVTRILRLKYRLGLFDATDAGHKYQSDVGSTAHKELARKAVQKSLVVVKNDEVDGTAILPLKKEGKIVVVGKHANNTGLQSGGWTRYWQGVANTAEYKDINNSTTIWENLDGGQTGTSIYKGIEEVAQGATVVLDENGSGIDADVAIVVVGEYPYAEWYGDDDRCGGANGDMWQSVCDGGRERVGRLELFKYYPEQKALIDAYTSKDIPVVVVLVTGRLLPISEQIDASTAVVVAWLPGSEGAGVADVLFGDAPATGLLPHAWPDSESDIPVVGDDSKAKFPYGHGITYGAK